MAVKGEVNRRRSKRKEKRTKIPKPKEGREEGRERECQTNSTDSSTSTCGSTLPRPPPKNTRIFLFCAPPTLPHNTTPNEKPEDESGTQASTSGICNVCGSNDVAAGFKQCQCHRRTISTIIASLAKIGLNPEEQIAHTDFKNMIFQAPDNPPSQLSETVLAFEAAFPGRGRGKRRGHSITDTMRIIRKTRPRW